MAADLMSLLRIQASLAAGPEHCSWVLIADGREPFYGEGSLAGLSVRADRIQLVLPAAEVLITRARLPEGARRLGGSVLAFAIEDQTVTEPDANQVSWLGTADNEEVLATMDRQQVQRWYDAMEAAGIRAFDIHCETLMLPLKNDQWTLAWEGGEGYVRNGKCEGAAMDGGDRSTPPLSLRLMLDEARKNHVAPASIAVYATVPDAMPDLEAWQKELGIPLQSAGMWESWKAPADAGVSLARGNRRWQIPAGMGKRLKPAAAIVAAALAIHAVALVIDWTSLANEQQKLRQGMETRFRATFPDTVAVVDPALQMRRKLTEARHAAGQVDAGDFLPMIDKAGAALKDMPAGSVRIVSFEGGRLTLELATTDEAITRRVVARLLQAGLNVDPVAPRSGGTAVITARAS